LDRDRLVETARLANLHPELALLRGMGVRLAFLISALSATRWEAGVAGARRRP
jgi:hypothetical protein